MSNNTTSPNLVPPLQSSLDVLTRNFVPCFIWVPLGLLGAVTSALVIATFFNKKAESLRTNYFLNVMHIAVADLFMGLVHASLGLKRSILLWTAWGEISTPARCLIDLGAIQTSQLASTGQVVAMAIDRLLAVAAPVWYHKKGLWRFNPINSCFWALSFASPWIMARNASGAPLIATCSIGFIYRMTDPDYIDFQLYVQQAFIGITIGIYVLMVLILWLKRKSTGMASNAYPSEAVRKKNANANRLAAAIVAMYLGTWALAVLYNTAVNAWVDPIQRIRWIPYQPLMSLLSLPGNFVLYYYLDRDFRAALKKLTGRSQSQVSNNSAIISVT